MIKRTIFPSPEIKIPEIKEKTIIDRLIELYGKYHQKNTNDRLYFFSDAYYNVQGLVLIDGYDSNRIRVKADVDQAGYLGHVVAVKKNQFIKRVRLDNNEIEFSFPSPDLVIIYFYDMDYYVDIDTEIALIPNLIEVSFISDNSVVKKVSIDGVAIKIFNNWGVNFDRWWDGYVFIYPTRENVWGFIEFLSRDVDNFCITAYDSYNYIEGNILASRCCERQTCSIDFPRFTKMVVAYSPYVMAINWGEPYWFDCNILPDTTLEPFVTKRLIRK